VLMTSLTEKSYSLLSLDLCDTGFVVPLTRDI